MVALSLYRGNLHKVSDVPRRWPRPTPKITLKDFRILLRRRSRALSRLDYSTSADDTASNPNPISISNHDDSNPNHEETIGALNDNQEANQNDNGSSLAETQLPDSEELEGRGRNEDQVNVKGDTEIESEESLKKLEEKTDAALEEKNGSMSEKEDKVGILINADVERGKTDDVTKEKEKRKKEIMEKLEILNAKKHSLVQVLKQILGAEEQLKRQNSMPGVPGRPPLPLQVDTATDTGSVTRINTPRIGADGNPCGDMDGGETDDASNHNIRSHHLQRMSSTSPSSDSQLRKPVANMVPLTHRTLLGVTGSPSPSRFAPPGQVQSSVSISGTSYVASSPSPAASGGTSVFRDARLPSPWN